MCFRNGQREELDFLNFNLFKISTVTIANSSRASNLGLEEGNHIQSLIENVGPKR